MAGQYASYVLLAEFDIDIGPTISHEYPLPTGIDEQLLAELMLPEGAHDQPEDWTVFFLNQTPNNTITPVFDESGSDVEGEDDAPGGEGQLLYVLNLVRSKRDKTVRRGGVVKALAICTRHPHIQIYKPALVLALEDCFTDGSRDCLGRLFDAVNAMDLSLCPTLTRAEKIILRLSERHDMFAEKFVTLPRRAADPNGTTRSSLDGDNFSLTLTRPSSSTPDDHPTEVQPPRTRTSSLTSASDASFSLGGNAVLISEERSSEKDVPLIARPSSRSESISVEGIHTPAAALSTDRLPPLPFTSGTKEGKDTHYHETRITYQKLVLNIRWPMSTFPEEVGDFSLIQLIQTFSQPGVTIGGPLHPHLHTNGAGTHPIILLFNALVTEKRVLFLGHGMPAGQVANFVLAACALVSGGGSVLRGFTERAFPYAHLSLYENVMKDIPGYIGGVTNPIFESKDWWDVLCNIETGKITVHRDIKPAPASPSLFTTQQSLVPKGGVLKAEASSIKEVPGASSSSGKVDAKPEKAEADNLFMEDILAMISQHCGEAMVRARFTDYVSRFVRLAARYEEDVHGGTSIGYTSQHFTEGTLGSGVVFPDANTALRDMSANAARIEGWRHTKSYEYYTLDFQLHLQTRAIRGFDVGHQIWRLNNDKNLSASEVELMMRSFASELTTYDQVAELLSMLPQHRGGLLPITFGLYHQDEQVRYATAEVIALIIEHPIGMWYFKHLNAFHRVAYGRYIKSDGGEVMSSARSNQSMSEVSVAS